MSLSIRHWLAERQIELATLRHPGTQIAGIAFRIAQDMEVKSLTPFDISALAEVLELPLRTASLVAGVVSQLSVGLLHILSQKKPLKRNEGTWLTFQIAYINALQGILEQESLLRRPWLSRAGIPGGSEDLYGQVWDSPLADVHLQAFLKTLRPGRLSDTQAEQALLQIGNSFLVQQMNSTCIAWLIANGAEETEAKLITQRLANGLPGYLLEAIAQNALPLAQLQKFVQLGSLVTGYDNIPASGSNDQSSRFSTTLNSEEPELNFPPQHFPLNRHRESYRAALLQSLSKPLLAEPFSLKDLYVPLKGKEVLVTTKQPLGKAAITNDASPPVDLMEWVTLQLEDKKTITAIEADSGMGKTSFCQIFATHVAQQLYPKWMPVLIRLKDATLGKTLEETLNSAFPLGRFKDADGWFSILHPPCLLILDGLDELPRSDRTGYHFAAFLNQVTSFQARSLSLTKGTPRHKIILTSRRGIGEWGRGSEEIPYSLFPLMRRITIQPLEQDEFRQWFKNWAKLQSKAIAQGYFSFLKQRSAFTPTPERTPGGASSVANTLVGQPLMLYLMGVLHRDGLLDDSIFHRALSEVKFEIYDRIYCWLLAYPDAGSTTIPFVVKEGLAHAYRSTDAIANLLANRRPEDVRQVMQVTALSIVQTCKNKVTQSALKSKHLEDNLPIFFFQIPNSQSPISSIEFSHPNLGEYLCAEEIALQLQALTDQFQDTYGELNFTIKSSLAVAQHLYQLLGYGLLSVEIEEMVVERLRRQQERKEVHFSLGALFKRLYRFYRAYCRGRWLDEGIAHQVYAQFQALHNPLKVLQIDAAVGVNVFLLLCAIARQSRIPFLPCGDPNQPLDFDPDALLSFIGRTAVLSPTAFWERARHNLLQVQLTAAYLNHAWFADANLQHANLSWADLTGTNLADANLQQANLSWANLAGANLSGANLSGAKLEGADLSGANLLKTNLTQANVSHACLFEALLDDQNHHFARKNGAIFSLEEFQAYRQSLAYFPSMGSNQTKMETESTAFPIESAEGEPFLPNDQESESEEEETVVADTYGLEGSTLPKEDPTDADYQYRDETAIAENPLNRN
ncbi:NACHT domain-containing protein [Funiculus sociatus]|uniref:NACHT domain-containing protein n=1 Tax=Funiculus sociatus TaxID=450527 RepID=UPI003299D953